MIVELKNIGGYEFQHVCAIEPLRAIDGSIREFAPQARYANVRNLSLNRYGSGPFCKFQIPRTYNSSGVYAICTGHELKYIGECRRLSERFNMGYGNISPRNCFVKGQETNCRLNNLICQAAKRREPIFLWFHQATGYKAIEANLRIAARPEWNRI